MLKLIITLVLGSLFFANTSAYAYDDQGTLKAAVLAKFLKEANNPRSAIGKEIARMNKETEDGRNQEGTIKFPIKKEHLQVAMIEAEDNHVPWHYADKDNGDCHASGDTARFAIYLAQDQGVHYANAFSTVVFVGEAKEYMRARILIKDSADVYCEDLGAAGEGDSDVKETFGKIETTIKLSKIKLVAFPSVDLEK